MVFSECEMHVSDVELLLNLYKVIDLGADSFRLKAHLVYGVLYGVWLNGDLSPPGCFCPPLAVPEMSSRAIALRVARLGFDRCFQFIYTEKTLH